MMEFKSQTGVHCVASGNLSVTCGPVGALTDCSWRLLFGTGKKACSAGFQIPEICYFSDERAVILRESYKAGIGECIYPEKLIVNKEARSCFKQLLVDAGTIHQKPTYKLGGEC